MTYRIAVDSGGTFTDGVLIDASGAAVMRKAHTTPENLTIGTIDCMDRLAQSQGLSLEQLLAQTQNLVLGTTMATNAVATLSGPKLATISTKGFRMRMAFPQVAKAEWKEGPADMYDFRALGPESLVDYRLMTEVEERVNFAGKVITPLNEAECRAVARRLREEGVETVAVTLLHSHVNASHERRVGEILAEECPAMHVTLSSSVLPVGGEGERWGTAMFSAYVAPVVRRFVGHFTKTLQERGFRGQLQFIQSNGGLAAPEIVAENPAVLLLSGPAAGPSLGRSLGLANDYANVLSVDMGGTSFDVGVVHGGSVDTVRQQVIHGKKFALPSVDVTAIGAGGGSIAHVDGTGRLHVGPKSASANPGPACYDKGGSDPTVTDANVVLGYIDPDYFLGGDTRLRKDLAERAIREQIAQPLGLSVPEAAAAIYEVINSNMASGTDVAFAKRGYDPRDFALIAAGGAAAVHAVRLMQELRINKLIVPKVGPIYCAYGMMFCDLRHDFQRTYFCDTTKVNFTELQGMFDAMEREARETLRREGVEEAKIDIRRSVDMKYYGQFRDRNARVAAGPVTAQSIAGTIEKFHAIHEQTVGYCDKKYPTEIVRLHLSGSTSLSTPKLQKIAKGSSAEAALKKKRPAYFSPGGFVDTPIYDGERLGSGVSITGPAIIEEIFTTFVIPPGASAIVDDYGNYITTRKEG